MPLTCLLPWADKRDLVRQAEVSGAESEGQRWDGQKIRVFSEHSCSAQKEKRPGSHLSLEQQVEGANQDDVSTVCPPAIPAQGTFSKNYSERNAKSVLRKNKERDRLGTWLSKKAHAKKDWGLKFRPTTSTQKPANMLCCFAWSWHSASRDRGTSEQDGELGRAAEEAGTSSKRSCLKI